MLKHLCCLILLLKQLYIFFRILWWIDCLNERHLFEIEIFINSKIAYVFTILDQFNAFLLNKNIESFKQYWMKILEQ